jgi:hypothetical protein
MELPKFTEQTNESPDLQRTAEWHEERLGLFTGSEIKKLMSCKSKKAGKNWLDHFWLFDFGDTAITYIIEKALERATGNQTEHFETFAMSRGINLEVVAKEYFIENYKKNEVGFEFLFKEHGFIKFQKNAGSSVDGELIFSNKNIGVIAFENKCPENVRIHMQQCLNAVDESNQYFWQLISEMLSLKTSNGILVSFDPRFPEGAKLKYINIEISKAHTFALKFRLIVAEKIVETLLKTNFSCDINAELEAIANQVPTDFAGLENWYFENIKDLEL